MPPRPLPPPPRGTRAVQKNAGLKQHRKEIPEQEFMSSGRGGAERTQHEDAGGRVPRGGRLPGPQRRAGFSGCSGGRRPAGRPHCAPAASPRPRRAPQPLPPLSSVGPGPAEASLARPSPPAPRCPPYNANPETRLARAAAPLTFPRERADRLLPVAFSVCDTHTHGAHAPAGGHTRFDPVRRFQYRGLRQARPRSPHFAQGTRAPNRGL